MRGAFFGLHVDRPRLFESNFPIHVDQALSRGGNRLRRGTCLGHRRRWRRLDPFGRPEMADCCQGNLWAVQGDKPYRCAPCECADAMGLDRDHMSFEGMTQAIPPVYAELIFAQACMRDLEREGVPAITYDEMEANPSESVRRLIHWQRGAGGANPDQGVEFEVARAEEGCPEETREGGADARSAVGGVERAEPAYAPQHKDQTGDEVRPATEDSVRESELRELHYSWAGDFDACCVHTSDAERLRAVRPVGRAVSGDEDGWVGKSVMVSAHACATRRTVLWWKRQVAAQPGSRVVVEARGASGESGGVR